MCEINQFNPAQSCPAPGVIDVWTIDLERKVRLCRDCFNARYQYRPAVAPAVKPELEVSNDS